VARLFLVSLSSLNTKAALPDHQFPTRSTVGSSEEMTERSLRKEVALALRRVEKDFCAREG